MSARPAISTVDPVGWYMTGFLHDKTPDEARAVAAEQHHLARVDGDTDGVDWWDRVLTWLDAQASLAARVARMPKAGR